VFDCGQIQRAFFMDVRFGLVAVLGLGLVAACGAPGEGAAVRGVDPASEVHVAKGQPEAQLGQVLTSVAPDSLSIAPEFEYVKLNARCAGPRATASAKVVRIYSYGGGSKSPLYHAYKTVKESSIKRYQRTDVVVTETAQPVYLILDSYNAVLWNLQLAEGVKLAGVAVNSYEGSAVANVPKGVRVGMAAFRGSDARKCWRKMPNTLPAVQRAAAAKNNNYNATSSDLAKWDEEYKKSKRVRAVDVPKWYGSKIDEDVFPALVGPIPETPMEPKTISRVFIGNHVDVAWGPREDAQAALDELAMQQYEALR
jgi:hypothetical protein